MMAVCLVLTATVFGATWAVATGPEATATGATATTATTPAAPGDAEPQPAEVFNYGRFGTVSVYRGRGEPRNVALFLSGDGGWNLGVVSMARRLADKNSAVAGNDIRHHLAQLEGAGQECVAPAPDFENLSHYLQSQVGVERYLRPT